MKKFHLPKELLIATHNPGKLSELKELFANYNVTLFSALDFNINAPEEDKPSFKENALLKAAYYGKHAGMVALADDSGLCIDDLNGAPGIYSARWAGKNNDFTLAMRRIEEALQKKAQEGNNLSYRAAFICALAIWSPDDELVVEGSIAGRLRFPLRGAKGFGYDPIFIPNGYTQTFGEMDPALKSSMSHRADAWQKLLQYL